MYVFQVFSPCLWLRFSDFAMMPFNEQVALNFNMAIFASLFFSGLYTYV